MERLTDIESLISQYNHKGKEVTAATSFEELGMDSYEIVDFLLLVEKQFNVFIPEEKMLDLKTIGDVLDILERCSQEEN